MFALCLQLQLLNILPMSSTACKLCSKAVARDGLFMTCSECQEVYPLRQSCSGIAELEQFHEHDEKTQNVESYLERFEHKRGPG